MDIDEARALLETVLKGKLAGEGIIKAIEVTLRSYSAILNNLVMLEDKFDGSAEEKVDDLTNRLIANTRTIKIKNEYLQLIYDILIDYDGCNTVESLKELIDEARQYVKQAFTNDDKSVIYTNWNKGNIIKQNILGEEVE